MASVRFRGLAAAIVLGALAATASARAEVVLPPENEEPAFKALAADLERIVEAQESGGWRIDHYEIVDMIPSTLMPVCRVPVATRARVLAWYNRRIVLLGGPVEEAFERANRDISAIRPLVFVTRVRDLLAEANRRAVDECPYWLTPDAKFHGFQNDRHRWNLNVETGGLVQLRKTEGHWTYGGGGVIRGLFGRGYEHTTLLFGPEFAGGAMLKVGGGGTVVINYFPAIPVVLRMHDRSWHYDVELAAVSLFQANDTRLSFGMRFGLGFGVQARRTRGLLPWAGFAFAYETYFPGAREQMSFLRGGLRVGVVWN
jgi:hypothetical protein